MTTAALRPPGWPLLVLVLGWLLGGPGGLLLAALITAGLLLVRLRLQVADPHLPDLPKRRTKPPSPSLPGFSRTVSSVEWGLNSPYDFDTALRPRLQRVLAARLAERHRIDIETAPKQARQLIGDDLWPLVDPSRPASWDRQSAGPTPETLARVLAAIERI